MFSTIFGIRETCRFQNFCSFLFCKMGTMPKMYCNTQHTPSTYSHTCHTVQCSEETVLQHMTRPSAYSAVSLPPYLLLSAGARCGKMSQKTYYSGCREWPSCVMSVRPITGCTCCRRHLSTNVRRPREL